jgi:asparagine synthase (glutamine-hydrolysing)
MCGIVGLAARAPVAAKGWLAAGCEALAHRGPDAAGVWWGADDRVGLGFRRLAIIDLTLAGHQPMHAASGVLTLVFNGEIYNFQELREELIRSGVTFHSHADSEVILGAYQLWGTDCLSRLNGMFAFALYDAGRGRLFLARDRAGEKPLFYAVRDGSIRFASELKGLMAAPDFPRAIDPAALDCYLGCGFVPPESSILEGVEKLPPAHALTFDVETGELRRWRYWQLPELDSNAETPEGELLEELHALLDDSVRRQLVADVPLGILLSGGVDSSLVTAIAARQAPGLKTFTIRFPGHRTHDETKHARLIARHFATDHMELEAEPTTVDLLGNLARQFDEPMIDSSMIPTFLVSKMIRQHCTVALGGDGGDELFGGYTYYHRLLRMQRSIGWIPRPLRGVVGKAAGSLLPVGFKGRNWLRAMDTNLANELPMLRPYFDAGARRQLMRQQTRWKLVAEREFRRRTPSHGNLLQRATRMDFENYLPEDLLVKVDRASMLSSVEVRAPLLDYRVVEFAFGRVPSRLKATHTGRKILLKRLAARLLPPDFDQMRKQGFSIPLDAWLRSDPWRAYFAEVLLDPGQELFDHAFVRKLLDGQQGGRANGERLFGLVMFELWRREYGAALAA